MRKVNASFGTKRSEGFKSRVKAGQQAVAAHGKRLGSAHVRMKHVVVAAICETCDKEFLWTAGYQQKALGVKHQKTGRFCSKLCLVRWLHKHRTVLSNIEEIKRLYWDEGMTLWEIAHKYGMKTHKAVSAAMLRGGLRIRTKDNGKKICIVRGCDKPTFKIIHPNNKSPYGRRCEEHWLEHRQKLYEDWHARTGGQFPEQIIKSMNRGNVTTDAIAEDTGLKPVSVKIALGRMRKAGRVEVVGRYRKYETHNSNTSIWGLTTT